MSIGERIVKVRTEEGLSQVEFARQLNLSKQTVSNYETGARQPGLDIILKISEIFGISTDYLLGRSDFKMLENNRWSLFVSGLLDTTTMNRLARIPQKDLALINTLFVSGGLDNLMNTIIRYHCLSEKEINEYGKLVYGNDSRAFKMINTFDKGYLKKKMLSTLFDEAIGVLMEELDELDELDDSEEEDEE